VLGNGVLVSREHHTVRIGQRHAADRTLDKLGELRHVGGNQAVAEILASTLVM